MRKERSTSSDRPMREERGQIAGPFVVHEPLTLWGTIIGKVTVVEGGKFYLRGAIYGDLTVEYGGRVHAYGNVSGDLVVERGTKVIISGTIMGDVTNRGGRLYIDVLGDVKGRLRTLKGETRDDRRPPPIVLPKD